MGCAVVKTRLIGRVLLLSLSLLGLACGHLEAEAVKEAARLVKLVAKNEATVVERGILQARCDTLEFIASEDLQRYYADELPPDVLAEVKRGCTDVGFDTEEENADRLTLRMETDEKQFEEKKAQFIKDTAARLGVSEHRIVIEGVTQQDTDSSKEGRIQKGKINGNTKGKSLGEASAAITVTVDVIEGEEGDKGLTDVANAAKGLKGLTLAGLPPVESVSEEKIKCKRSKSKHSRKAKGKCQHKASRASQESNKAQSCDKAFPVVDSQTCNPKEHKSDTDSCLSISSRSSKQKGAEPSKVCLSDMDSTDDKPPLLKDNVRGGKMKVGSTLCTYILSSGAKELNVATKRNFSVTDQDGLSSQMKKDLQGSTYPKLVFGYATYVKTVSCRGAASPNFFARLSPMAGRCLECKAGGKLFVTACDPANRDKEQSWEYNHKYNMVRLKHSGKCLQASINPGSTGGESVSSATCDCKQPLQKWKYTRPIGASGLWSSQQEYGQIQLVHQLPGPALCMHSTGSGTVNLQPCKDSDPFFWAIYPIKTCTSTKHVGDCKLQPCTTKAWTSTARGHSCSQRINKFSQVSQLLDCDSVAGDAAGMGA